jgi:hypothetical protein
LNIPRPDGALSGLSWEDAICAVLADNGPLHVKEIWQRLAAGGFRTTAKDPLRSIVAVATRSPNLIRAWPNIYGIGNSRGSTLRNVDR